MSLKEKWIVRGGRAAPIVEKYAMAPFIARILAGRLNGMSVEQFLDREGSIFDPSLLLDMDKAVHILQDALRNREKICIVGDYDVDGMTSAAILYLGIRYLYPSADLMCRIPERITDGYGFSRGIAEELVSEGIQTAITCDNGVREFETAEYLKEQHVRLIITDHHEIAKDESGNDVLPEADAIVNPHREGDPSPDHTICGAFVAFQVMRALAVLEGKDPDNDPMFCRLKGYAAMGTICDVMPLTGNNRRIVYQGLKLLNQAPPEGIRCMMKTASVKELSTYSVGYVIGPMINAGGRLGSQNRFLSILTSDSPAVCSRLSQELFLLNKNRQMMTEQGIKDGLKQAEKYVDDIIKVIYLPGLHESIAGLVAGKLKESLNRPVFVVTKGTEGLKGSGRSIETYPMFSAMNEVGDIFEKYGGHAMAAGFSLKSVPGQEETAVDGMRKILNQRCRLTEEDLVPVVYLDSTMDPSKITLDLVRKIEMLGPFGTSNPRPLLAVKGVCITGCSPLGKTGRYFSVYLRCPGGYVRAVCFEGSRLKELLAEASGLTEAENMLNGQRKTKPVMVDLAYSAEEDSYKGNDEVKIVIRHLRLSQGA